MNKDSIIHDDTIKIFIYRGGTNCRHWIFTWTR